MVAPPAVPGTPGTTALRPSKGNTSSTSVSRAPYARGENASGEKEISVLFYSVMLVLQTLFTLYCKISLVSFLYVLLSLCLVPSFSLDIDQRYNYCLQPAVRITDWQERKSFKRKK